MSELLKISELAARAGVEKSTIQHYLREGLLPSPALKTHRNMAYYSGDLVERIRFIKELQTRHFLPLKTIRRILKDKKTAGEIRAYLYARPTAPGSIEPEPVPQERILADTGLTEAQLEKLESIGFIRGQTDAEGAVIYDSVDATIVHAVAAMQRAGLNAENGFQLKDMVFYHDAMKNLMSKEIAVFSRVTGRDADPMKIFEMARAGIEGTNVLLMALRRKLFLGIVGDEFVTAVLSTSGKNKKKTAKKSSTARGGARSKKTSRKASRG